MPAFLVRPLFYLRRKLEGMNVQFAFLSTLFILCQNCISSALKDQESSVLSLLVQYNCWRIYGVLAGESCFFSFALVLWILFFLFVFCPTLDCLFLFIITKLVSISQCHSAVRN
mmetsp:Transcript_48374/g.125436  ORF Transcript_48374/g.125436 Transcript_48374/m.125436 type:complete len:114 (-) Transcript_48374:33-374(-)